MIMDKELITAIENSPVWKEATSVMNKAVDEANKEGRKMSQGERDKYQEMRALLTLAIDPKVKKMYSDRLFKQNFIGA